MFNETCHVSTRLRSCVPIRNNSSLIEGWFKLSLNDSLKTEMSPRLKVVFFLPDKNTKEGKKEKNMIKKKFPINQITSSKFKVGFGLLNSGQVGHIWNEIKSYFSRATAESITDWAMPETWTWKRTIYCTQVELQSDWNGNPTLCGFQFAFASPYRCILTFPPEITNPKRLRWSDRA